MNPEHIDLVIKYSAYVVACFVAHWPANWLIRKTIKRWQPDKNDPQDKLGAFIGTLERSLVIILIGMNALTAVGLVVTMKSIARYDKLQKEKAFAEYFLAGTLLSTLIALILGIVLLKTVGAI